MDRQAEDDNDNDNWESSGTSPNTKQQDPFSTSAGETGGGWGSSNNDQAGGTWTPSTTDGQQNNDTNISIPADNQEKTDVSRYGSGINAATMGAADGEEAPVWFMERVCVELKKNKAAAVIKEINNNVAVVEMEDKSTATIYASECTIVAPKEHDTVLVTGGIDVAVEGELICIDGTDAILKDSKNDGEFKIVDLIHLAKIAAD